MKFFKKLGKVMLQQMTGIELEYLGGHPELTRSQKVIISTDENAVQLLRGGRILLSIPRSDIINVSLDRASKRSLGKAGAGALIGGVLTGSIGLIAGGVLGGRKKDDSIIALTVNYESSTVDLIFSGENVTKKYGRVAALLRRKG